MIVEGSYEFPAQRDDVWRLLLDPEVIGQAMPGATEMVCVAHEKYAGRLRVGIGSITAAEFDVSITLVDVIAPERYTMLIDGRGRFGFTRGSATVELAADGASPGTLMRYRADLQVGGKIAAVGQRLLDSVSRLLTKQGLEALAREVTRRLGVPSAQTPIPKPQTPPLSSQPSTPEPETPDSHLGQATP